LDEIRTSIKIERKFREILDITLKLINLLFSGVQTKTGLDT
jgi:hypothetical protein